MLFALARSRAVGQHCAITLVGDGIARRLQRGTSGYRGADAGSRATNRGGAATEARAYTGIVRARSEGVGGPMQLSDVTSNRESEGTQPMNRMTISLFYLGSYLAIIGLGLLFVPHETLKILQSNGDYDDVFPRVAGMLMSGLGLSIFGMISARASELYPATLFIRVYFIGCIAAFYAMTGDPLFLVLIVIVGLGFVLTLGSYLLDRKSSR